MTSDCIDCPEHYEGRAVDNSAWDGAAAMSRCASSDTPASCYNSICAGTKAGDPNLQSSHALPHHMTAGGPPNAAGVRNAMARLSQTQGLTNAAAARTHLERHMSEISGGNGMNAAPSEAMEVRVLPVEGWEIRHSGRKDEAFTIRGYPAVYNETSHDLGGFREQIAPGAFDEVLSTKPDVHFVWDHDTRYVGARTKNGTLSLQSDTTGLFADAQIGNYSWAKDLRTALERGDISQGSFAFHVPDGGDEWAVDDQDKVMRTIRNVDALYDVTVTAQGAYPQTSLAAVRSLAVVRGRPLEEVEAALVAARGESESQKGSVEATEEFMRWKEARIKKAAAYQSTLAKLAEKLGKLE
jgi:HK97 family phage prohead protease